VGGADVEGRVRHVQNGPLQQNQHLWHGQRR
jgi:hypothetical protein